MKVNLYLQSPKTTNFKGVREDRNTVAQLKENNDYSLTEPNQRRINKAIENLAKQRGEENIKFLIDVKENLKYQTNFPTKNIKNDWSAKLKSATEESLYHSNPILREKYQPMIDKAFESKPLSKDEEYLNKAKNSLVKKVHGYTDEDKIKKNLEYFIASTETPIDQKKYVMKRLNYFMSDKYEINPQLKDKKPQILSELANDIALNTLDNDIPNIKAINQKTHGMCAAISIVRKAVAYEDKPNFIDAVLSELDSSDTVKIYDKQHLGSGKRVPVKKTYIDFDYAQQRGYRIIDASTCQWMNIGGMYGAQNESLNEFSAFDKNNFDSFHDAFFIKNFEDNDLMQKQVYYQALTKAEEDIKSLKSSEIKREVKQAKNLNNRELNIAKTEENNQWLRGAIREIMPETKKDIRQKAMTDLLKLYQPISSDIKKLPDELQKYSFIPNEETSQKQKKVVAFFNDNYSDIINKDALSKEAPSIVENIEELYDYSNKLSKHESQAQKIARARRFYEAEAGYRSSIVLGMMEKDVKTDHIIRHRLPDRETRISQGFSDVIEKIDKKNDKILLEHFATYFDTTPDNKDVIIDGLLQVKGIIDYMVTEGLDQQYKALGFGSRNEVLTNDIADSIEEIQNGSKSELGRAAACLGIKGGDRADKNAVLKELTEMKQALEENPQNERIYIDALNRFGYKDQIDAFIDVYNMFSNGLNDDSPMKDLYAQRFRDANGMDEKTPVEEVLAKLREISQNFNHISETIAGAANMLEVPDKDGEPYYTVNATNLILKDLENKGDLIPRKTMEKLQTRFAKIDKLRSSDEFASRQGKISDPSLYKLSSEEKEAIKHIEKKLNKMYGFVKRERNYIYNEIKEPLGDLIKYVGTNSGDYWVVREGQSGLFGSQEVKIFDQITDRPHKQVSDINEAIDIIKNSPHSGVSGSHVFNDKYGAHAMYIADVVKDEKTGKDILFHDNTWGASEHENVWVDSDGNTRTDYSDHRGGELGYITNKDWRNGNFVENLTYKKGHVSPDDTESTVYRRLNPNYDKDNDFSLMYDVIVEGKSPEYKNIAGAIKDEIFIPDAPHIKTLEKHAKNMTKREIQAAIYKNNSLRENYKRNYDNIIERITPNTFNKGITSEAEYNALSDDDPIKLAFEKMAVRDSFEDASMYKELGKAKTLDDIRKIKAKQRKRAKEDFYYAFNKNSATNSVFLAAAYNHGTDFTDALTEVTKKYGIKTDSDTLGNVIRNVALMQGDETKLYNGSVRNSINIFLERAAKQFDENIKDFDKKEEAKQEFLKNLEQVYEKNVYFNKEDLKLDTDKQRGIRMWIDDTFNPTTDEEFVNIYRMLQDMPKEEFDKYTTNLNDKYLGMKENSGYELLRRVQNANESAQTLLLNTVFFDEYADTVSMSKTREAFKYKKLERNSRGAYYVGERTFDDLYRTFNFALETLDYERLFNKYKDVNFRNHGALPAYPKINLGNDPVLNNKIEVTKNLVQEAFDTVSNQKNYIYDINLIHVLEDYRDSIPKDRPLTPIEHKVLAKLTGDFISANLTDTDMEDALNSAYEMLELKPDTKIGDYNQYIDTIIETIKLMEQINTVEDFEEANKAHSEALKNYFTSVYNTNIPPRFHRLMKEDSNNWMALEIASRKQQNAIDKNREILDLQLKVEKNLISDDKKGMIEGFVEINNEVNRIKSENYDKKVDSFEINKQIHDLHKLSDKYLDKYVDKSAIPNLRANFNDWYRKELVGGKTQKVTEAQLEAARNKFETDFKKHHLTSHPTEVLNNFLLLSAKDAEQTKQQPTYKQYLETELNLAKFIAIQDSLMEAVQSGNAAQVKEYFEEYDVSPYGDDNYVSMNSDTAIDYMIRSLLIDDNPETATMFVEKLGLGERILDIERRTIKEIDPKSKIDEIAKTLKDAYQLTETASGAYINLLENIDNIKDPDELHNEILKTKKEVIKALKYSDDKESKKILIKPLDDIQEFSKEKPDVTKSVVLASRLSSRINEVNEIYNAKIKDAQDYLNIVHLIYNFLENIQLPEYSKGKALQEKIAEEHAALTDYNNETLMEASKYNPNAVIKNM